MKNKGFISLIGIILIVIVLMGSIFVFERLGENKYIINTKINSIYSRNWSRNKILLGLYHDNYGEKIERDILGRIRSNSFLGDRLVFENNIRLNRGDLHPNEKNISLDYGIAGRSFKNELDIRSRSIIENIGNYSFAKARFINPIFMEGDFSERELKTYLEFIIKETEKNYGSSYYSRRNAIEVDWNFDNLNLYKLEDSYNISGDEVDKFFTKEYISIIMKNDFSMFTIASSENYEVFNLKGLLYINGNLYIKNDIDFKGVIIVNGKTYIEEGVALGIDGLFISKDTDGDFSYTYNLKNVFRDGSYLPGFINFDILEIRSEN